MRPGAAVVPAGVLCALVLSAPLSGQIDAEIRGGATVGSHTGTAAGLDLSPSFSYEALVLLGVKPRVGVYGGFVHTEFGCEEGFCLDRDLMVVGKHGAVGVELTRGSPWLRVGLLFGVTEVGTEGEASNLGLGVHAALGFTIDSGRVRFLPGLSYRRLSAGTQAGPNHATAVTVDLGVRVRMGSGGGNKVVRRP